ncbi:MAG: ParB N-terminal domain-containing protein [Lentimicrobium sp.]|nr:ParB N-terminal domain-containing protein [Lentimicrobium sp.]
MSEELKIIYRQLSELIEPDYNPRKISAKQREEIKKSLMNFGFVQPLVVNMHPERENIVIGGNQRKKIAEAMGHETAPCIEVNLDLEKEKELNLRLNKNQAEFDVDLLNEFFDREFLFDIGFTEKEVGKLESEFDQKFNAITNDEAEMPIVPKFNEKYNSIIIFCNNELDFNWIRNVLKLQRHKDYKNSRVGEAHVLTVQNFQEIWEEAVNHE